MESNFHLSYIAEHATSYRIVIPVICVNTTTGMCAIQWAHDIRLADAIPTDAALWGHHSVASLSMQ